jgi:hypothetical protein
MDTWRTRQSGASLWSRMIPALTELRGRHPLRSPDPGLRLPDDDGETVVAQRPLYSLGRNGANSFGKNLSCGHRAGGVPPVLCTRGAREAHPRSARSMMKVPVVFLPDSWAARALLPIDLQTRMDVAFARMVWAWQTGQLDIDGVIRD